MLARNMLSMSGLSLYRNAVQFGMNVAIAAFVLPGDYGLIVFTTPFLVLIAMLTDLGMTSAKMRKKIAVKATKDALASPGTPC